MEKQSLSALSLIVNQFCVEGTLQNICAYGNGHINATYYLETEKNAQVHRYILQQINTDIFKNPDQLMENIVGVTEFLKVKIRERGGDCSRETLQVIETKDGSSYYRDENGSCYRMYLFIVDSASYDQVDSAETFYESAVAFGNFQALLAEYPAHKLHETIPHFHDTKKRFENFLTALEQDICGRAKSVQEEIAFVMDRKDEMDCLTKLLASGELPMRVTHNDTKLNNIMIDDTTKKGICIIDLDTVMPGSALYDFGDSIRFGANTAAEDETDLSKVSLSLPLYTAYVKGYLEGCQGKLTALEKELLPVGAKMMTLECGMRFLTDYLQGDTYFRIHRPKHNLDRCRTQFALVADMEKKWDEMKAVVAAC